MTFHPLAAPVWLDVGPQSATHALPVDPAAAPWLFATIRLAAASDGGDILLVIGAADVVVDPESALLFLAGSTETIGLGGGATHIAVMTVAADAPATRLNVTIGTGD